MGKVRKKQARLACTFALKNSIQDRELWYFLNTENEEELAKYSLLPGDSPNVRYKRLGSMALNNNGGSDQQKPIERIVVSQQPKPKNAHQLVNADDDAADLLGDL